MSLVGPPFGSLAGFQGSWDLSVGAWLEILSRGKCFDYVGFNIKDSGVRDYGTGFRVERATSRTQVQHRSYSLQHGTKVKSHSHSFTVPTETTHGIYPKPSSQD